MAGRMSSKVTAFLITASSFATIAGLVSSCHRRSLVTHDGAADAQSSGFGRQDAWLPVDTAPDKTSQRIARTFVEQLAHQEVPSEHLGQLETATADLIRSLMIPDFDAYHRLMTANGADLDVVIADGYIAQLIEWGVYPAATPELASTRSIVDRLRYVWNTPSPRRLRWLAVNIESQTSGTGLVALSNSEAWPFSGYYSQMSLYAPKSGRLTQSDGARLNKTKQSVWIRLDIRCESDLTTKIRINFYFDQLSKTWYPVTTLIGNNWNVRGLPIL